MKLNKSSLIISGIFCALFSSCGATSGGDGDEECSSICVGDGSIQRAASKSIDVEFENSSRETQYLIAPFVLGDLAEVNGKSSGEKPKKLTAVIGSSSAGEEVDSVANKNPKMSGEITSFDGYSHALRSFWNRYIPRIEDSDSLFVQQELNSLEAAYIRFNKIDRPGRFLESVRVFDKRFGKRDAHSRRSTAKACPEEIFVPNTEEPLESNLLTFKEQGQGDFCLVIVKDGSLVSEKNPEVISESIASALATYKLIYKSDFELTRGDYAFRPLVIVVPMDDADIWPQDPVLQLAGAFVAAATEEHNRPTIYVPADMTKLGISAEKANESFHAAIAHELQHAIMNYHRVWRPDEPLIEVPSIDEGLAHFMEDLLGFGALNFGSFANVFLASTAIDPDAVLQDGTVAAVNESARGAAQSLTYYLMSQTGGVSFSGGTVDTENSNGLKFIRDFVEGNLTGVKGLSAALDSDWPNLFGGFVGALYIDNASKFNAKAKFSVQAPAEELTDTTGRSGKKFGMRFNDFGNLPTVEERLSQLRLMSSSNLEISIYSYQPQPILVKVGATTSQKIEVKSESDVKNFVATVIRLK